MSRPLHVASLLTLEHGTRLPSLAERPWCSRCEGLAWWLTSSGEHVCTSCLCRELQAEDGSA